LLYMPVCAQTGLPLHFHSSTTSGSASWMSLRISATISPRQSPSFAIMLSMSLETVGSALVGAAAVAALFCGFSLDLLGMGRLLSTDLVYISMFANMNIKK